MEINYISVESVRIAFRICNPICNKKIFFIHGNSGTSAVWEKQLTEPLFKNYCLIAIDMPGHGKSEHFKDPMNYNPLETGRFLAKLIKILAKDDQYCIVGFSYGTNALAETLSQGLNPKGIILASCCVIGKGIAVDAIFKSDDSFSCFFQNELNPSIIRCSFQKLFDYPDQIDIQQMIADYESVDKAFRPELLNYAREGKFSDEINLLTKLAVPICVIFGENDKLLNIDYLDYTKIPIWNDRSYIVSQAGHFVHLDQSKFFNTIIAEYFKERL